MEFTFNAVRRENKNLLFAHLFEIEKTIDRKIGSALRRELLKQSRPGNYRMNLNVILSMGRR